jgi:hypothetical protein
MSIEVGIWSELEFPNCKKSQTNPCYAVERASPPIGDSYHLFCQCFGKTMWQRVPRVIGAHSQSGRFAFVRGEMNATARLDPGRCEQWAPLRMVRMRWTDTTPLAARGRTDPLPIGATSDFIQKQRRPFLRV